MMTLKEALNFVDIGNQHILLAYGSNKEYYYDYMYEFEESEEYEKLLSLEVTSIDADGYNNTVVFYLW